MQRGGTLCAVAFLWLPAACSTPPGGLSSAADAGVVPPFHDADAVDGGVVDAGSPDAAAAPADAALPPDACVPYAADGDAGAGNPLGIRLTDITDEMPESFRGGRSNRDGLAFGSGVVLADLDGDGDLDIILARNDSGTKYPGGPTSLLENQGGFDHLVPHPGFAARFVGIPIHAASAADYDGDGDLDVFIGLQTSDVLLRNDGELEFTDVSEEAGIGGPDTHTSGGVWADLNRDGLIDLYVTTHMPSFGVADERDANRLYLNNGDGSFRDVTEFAGVAGIGSTHVALIGDLDGDRDLEIYVANDRFAADGEGGSTHLDGDRVYDLVEIDAEGRPRFEEKSQIYGIVDERSAMGIALADIDHDGIDDIYVSDFGSNHVERWNPAGPSYTSDFGYYGLNVRATPDDDLLISWGARFVDLDRDGWLEAFIINGAVSLPVRCDALLQRDLFFRSEGGVYSEITESVGLPYGWDCPIPEGDPVSGRGVVLGDLDGDGDDDLVIAPYIETYRFVRNDTSTCERPAARVRLRGTVSTAEAVGAVLEVELADGRVLRRPAYAGGDTYSQSDRVLEAALPVAAVSAQVHWPSGISQTLAVAELGAGATLVVEEPNWLRLEPRLVGPGDSPAIITVQLLDADGAPLGAAGAGRELVFKRSDGVATEAIDDLDGSYRASLPHPGQVRQVTIETWVDGVLLRPRPAVRFR